MKVQVLVRLKPGVLDVQGKAVEHGIHGLGLEQVSNVRIGRLIELDVPGSSSDEIRKKIEELCVKLLANPIIENYEIKLS